MKTIGETIRDLRRSHNITQEALAAMLGVTSQSVSQWENGRTMPDVSLLAPLAHIFDVSADVILGIDIDTKSAQIDALYDEAYTVAASGDHVRAIALADTALGRFPSSYRLMDFYANEVWLYNHICDAAVQDAQRERALAYLERVIGECTEHEIRNNSLMMACLWYHDLGRDTDAERIARTQQGIHFTYGELMGKITHGSRQFAYLRDEMLGQFTCAMGYLMDGLLGCTDDNGNPVYSDTEKLELNEMRIAMFERYFPDGDYLFHAQFAAEAHRQSAVLCVRLGDCDRALVHLAKAASFARQFDETGADAEHTSPAARGMETGGVWHHDGHNYSHMLLARIREEAVFAPLAGTAELSAILTALTQTAE
ncbi:MAG: helix-turn-helix transcriptional regulator [Ruminococcaceae bacterium]|nr:helix-turn-helix transcriptional regulator [Oscillospiraceae bacterium]